MELTKAKVCVISVGISGWYGKGVERLERSLNFSGYFGDVITWKDILPPNSPQHNDVPYYFKIAAFEWALYRGYTHILWLDASIWAVNSLMPIYDVMNEQGFYCFSSGYNLAQSVNDHALEVAGLDRDTAENVTEWATGVVGLNFQNPIARQLYVTWKSYMDQGLSKGSRNHDGQSQDPRFMHHRNDQSCFSLAMWKMGLRNERINDYIAYYSTNHNPERVILFINGI